MLSYPSNSPIFGSTVVPARGRAAAPDRNR